MSRILYIIRDILRTRQADPVVHQAHAGLAVTGDQAVQAFSVDRALVLNLHTVSLIEAVFDIGENTAEGLQRFPLGRDDQIPVNAAFQSQQRFIKLYLRSVGPLVQPVQFYAEPHRATLIHMEIRVVVGEAVQVGRVELIEHFPV